MHLGKRKSVEIHITCRCVEEKAWINVSVIIRPVRGLH